MRRFFRAKNILKILKICVDKNFKRVYDYIRSKKTSTQERKVAQMKMNEIKYMIQNAFDRVYGFSPARNKIVPLESGGCGNTIEWLAFAVGGIGYEYNAKTDELLKSESYNTRGWEE